jgi:preprotein translocase subunit SecE
MSSKSETQSLSTFDRLKLWSSGLMVAAAIVLFYYFGGESLLLRTVGLLVIVVAAAALALTTETGRNAWAFMQEARGELRRVIWPTRQETIQTTLAVFAMVVVIGIFLWLLDMLLLWAVRSLTG